MQKNAKARELENWEKARAKLKGFCEAPPHMRDLTEMSEVAHMPHILISSEISLSRVHVLFSVCLSFHEVHS